MVAALARQDDVDIMQYMYCGKRMVFETIKSWAMAAPAKQTVVRRVFEAYKKDRNYFMLQQNFPDRARELQANMGCLNHSVDWNPAQILKTTLLEYGFTPMMAAELKRAHLMNSGTPSPLSLQPTQKRTPPLSVKKMKRQSTGMAGPAKKKVCKKPTATKASQEEVRRETREKKAEKRAQKAQLEGNFNLMMQKARMKLYKGSVQVDPANLTDPYPETEDHALNQSWMKSSGRLNLATPTVLHKLWWLPLLGIRMTSVNSIN
jgi:hypothetical protein